MRKVVAKVLLMELTLANVLEDLLVATEVFVHSKIIASRVVQKLVDFPQKLEGRLAS